MCKCDCPSVEPKQWGFYPWNDVYCNASYTKENRKNNGAWILSIMQRIMGVSTDVVNRKLSLYGRVYFDDKCIKREEAKYLCEVACMSTLDSLQKRDKVTEMCNCATI